MPNVSQSQCSSELGLDGMTEQDWQRAGFSRMHLLVSMMVCIVLALTFIIWMDRSPKVPAVAVASYVGRQSCTACHQQQHDSFTLSHHHQALAPANQESVLANFDNQTLQHDGLTSRFYRDGEKYKVRTEGVDGRLAEFEVLFVLAYHPLQQYMVRIVNDLPPPSVNSRRNQEDVLSPLAGEGLSALQVLRLCWDVDNKRWYYLRPEDVPEKMEPGDPLHWTGVTQRWNTSCAACHSTNLEKNFDPLGNRFATTFAEVDVSCEACHGPASLHVSIAQKRWFSWDPNHGKGIFALKSASAKQQIDTCAGCHSRRRQLNEDFHQTREVHDHLIYEPMRPETYFVDGQIKDEDYVYGSFIQSKMHSKGIRCTDCHDPHSGKTYYQDNQLCTSCHAHPAGVFDSVQHHGHKMLGEGSKCVDCHMPHRYYMEVDPRRDHSIRVPRPDLSVALGVPNACTGCHLELKNVAQPVRSQLVHYQDWQKLADSGNQEVQQEISRVDAWADQVVGQWRALRGKPITDQHFGEILHAVRTIDPLQAGAEAKQAKGRLIKIATDVTASPMYRVTSLSEMVAWRDGKSLQTSIDLLEDDDAEVVFFAIQRLDSEINRWLEFMSYGASPDQCRAQIQQLVGYVVPLLNHKIRLVRTQAALLVTNLPAEIRDEGLGAEARNFEKSLNELLSVHLLNEELAAVADIYQTLGQIERAKEYYQLAIKHQPNSYGARTNLAVLIEQELQTALQRFRQNGNGVPAATMQSQLKELRVTLDQQALQAAEFREQDFQLLNTEVQRSGDLPTAGDVHYRFAMASYLRGDIEKAKTHLLIANQKVPNTAAYLLALATFYKAGQEPEKVIQLCQKLLRLDSAHPGYLALLKEAQGQVQQ